MRKFLMIQYMNKAGTQSKAAQWPIFLQTGALALGLCGLAAATETAPQVSIEMFGDAYARPSPAAASQAKILMYRAQALTPQSPANIYLNGQYHASLLKGGFTEFCVESGRAAVNVVVDDANRQHAGKLEAGQSIEMPAGSTVYLRLREMVPGKPQLQNVTSAEADAEMVGIRRQIHTVSRAAVVKDCAVAKAPTPVVPVAQPEPQKISMQADTLFEFGKSELRNSGYATLDSWIQQFNASYSSIERVKVLGYTDAIGPNQLNALLSQRRAEVVKEYLTTHGLKSKNGIEAEGRGSMELAKTGCAIKPTPENKECHAPNRRVVMVITGSKK
jgi:OOP family OmpA-OmpF porin